MRKDGYPDHKDYEKIEEYWNAYRDHHDKVMKWESEQRDSQEYSLNEEEVVFIAFFIIIILGYIISNLLGG